MKNTFTIKILGTLLAFLLVITFLLTPIGFNKSNTASAETKLSENISESTEKQHNDFVQTADFQDLSLTSYEGETLFADKVDKVCSDNIQSEFEERPYWISEIAKISFKIESSNDIVDLNYDCQGFEFVQLVENDKSYVNVSLKFTENADSMHFKLIVEFSSDNILVANVYGYQVDDLYYLSRASEENKDLLFYEYALANNEISIEQYEEILQDTSCMPIEDTEYHNSLKNSNDIIANNDVSQAIPMATTALNSTICGTWRWYDGTYYHPLKYALVNITIPNGGQSCNTSTTISTYTNANGYFSYTLQTASSIDVKVQVRSEGPTTKVRKNSLNSSYSTSVLTKTLNPGSSVSFDYYLPNTSTAFKAFHVCQALNMGAKYVEEMTGSAAPKATCHYPKDSNQYSSFWDAIDITEEAYEYWDIILHEYGHKLQHYYKIQDNPGGKHIITEDQIANHGKSKGIRLAWGEGWPTFFAILVTQYYGSELTNVKYTNDSKYDSYSYDSSGALYHWSQSLESSSVSGEGCEAAVFSVLYDFYDPYSSGETWDNLSLSHTTLFKAVINSGAKTFSDFINYFINNYYGVYDGKIGAILSRYGMSSTNLYISSGTLSYLTPPSFSWTAGGPSSCTFNSFQLVFYNSSNTEVLRTTQQSSTSLTLTSDQWAQILSASGTNITVAVVSYQNDNPSTGAYYSAQLIVAKPTKINPEVSLYMSTSDRYIERKITLTAGQYYDYLFTSSFSSYKIFQTFGSKDTKLELYSDSGSILYSNDDGGYGLNGLIRYYISQNTTYRLRVKFYSSSQYGTTKLAVTSSYGATKSNVFNIENYEDIYSITGSNNFEFSSFAQKSYSRLITFTASSSANYTFSISSDFDTYIYVIDPRSSECIIYGQDTNDDSGEGMNPLLTKKLESGIPYLVIFSAFNPGTMTETKDLTVKIKKA